MSNVFNTMGYYIINGKTIPKYSGTLSRKKDDIGLAVKKAIYSYECQIRRCNDSNHKSYRDYGARGIEVRYGKREFVSWHLHQQSELQLDNPNVDRIDSNGDYCFTNIRLIEKSENSREAIFRNARSVDVYYNGLLHATVEATSKAAKLTGLSQTTIYNRLRGLTVPRIGHEWTFAYSEMR